MKFAKTEGETFVFQMGAQEKAVLLEVLKLYPLIPASHHRLAKNDPDANDEQQKMLEEAVAEQRRENKEQLQTLLSEPQRFQKAGAGYHLHLSRAQIDWLLQVLNDIRVGSWLILGSPDEKKGQPFQVNEGTVHHIWAMELCGYFQGVLLGALDPG